MAYFSSYLPSYQGLPKTLLFQAGYNDFCIRRDRCQRTQWAERGESSALRIGEDVRNSFSFESLPVKADGL